MPSPLLGSFGVVFLERKSLPLGGNASRFLATVSMLTYGHTHARWVSAVGRKQVAEEEQRTWEMLSEERRKEVKVSSPMKRRGRGWGGGLGGWRMSHAYIA